MRLILLAVILTIGLFAAPVAAKAQPATKVWRIGILQTSAQKDEAGRVAALEQGLAEHGYVGGAISARQPKRRATGGPAP